MRIQLVSQTPLLSLASGYLPARYAADAYALLPHTHRDNNNKARQRETTRTTTMRSQSLGMKVQDKNTARKWGKKSVAQLMQAPSSWEVGIADGPPKRGRKSHNTYIHTYIRKVYLKQQKQKKKKSHVWWDVALLFVRCGQNSREDSFQCYMLPFSYSTTANLACILYWIFIFYIFVDPSILFVKNLGCCFLSLSFCFWVTFPFVSWQWHVQCDASNPS